MALEWTVARPTCTPHLRGGGGLTLVLPPETTGRRGRAAPEGQTNANWARVRTTRWRSASTCPRVTRFISLLKQTDCVPLDLSAFSFSCRRLTASTSTTGVKLDRMCGPLPPGDFKVRLHLEIRPWLSGDRGRAEILYKNRNGFVDVIIIIIKKK